MQPILMRHVQSSVRSSFKAWTNCDPHLHNPWHYHPECEITLIDRGSGILFIGDRVINYGKDDLVMIGPNLPHEWRSNIKESPDFYSRSVAVHFKKDFPGDEFYKLPETQSINRLLEKSSRGIRIQDPIIQRKVKEKLIDIQQIDGIKRINLLFSILYDIDNSFGIEFLSSQYFVDFKEEGNEDRINIIFKYVIDHFKEDVSESEMAAMLNMTKTSFCRFFKQRTNRRFIQYVNEVRIGFACKLLYDGEYSISEIAYNCGFQNISYFNRQFLKEKKMTPSLFSSRLIKKR